MSSLTDDLWTVILARLPIKSITASKLVCKHWKSIVESPFLREVFLSHHQNSHPSWSVMCLETQKEVIAHQGCDTWGLQRSLGSYLSSFLVTINRELEHARAVAYTDVGLILIQSHQTYYVANPITRQCEEIPPIPKLPRGEVYLPSGLVTRFEKGVLLGYKVVLLSKYNAETSDLRVLVFSSETDLWSFNTLRSSFPTLRAVFSSGSVCLNGTLYWHGRDFDYKTVIVSHDFYGTGTESDRCQVTLFPDFIRAPNSKKAFTTSQGYLMYVNVFKEDKKFKLIVWMLESGKWKILSETSPTYIKTGSGYCPLAIDPFDYTVYMQYCRTHDLDEGKFGFHNLECRSGTLIRSFVGEWPINVCMPYTLSTFALPRWLYQIPSAFCMVKGHHFASHYCPS